MTEESLFVAAMEKNTPAELAAFLDAACAGDAALRARIEALLQSHSGAGSFLAEPAVERVAAPPEAASCATVDAPAPAESVSGVIGPYKLLQQIGEGGMGTVWMAEQTQPVQRKVALKIIKPGMDSRQIIARFEAERQALAMMDHPNIAKVLDGGTTGPVANKQWAVGSQDKNAGLLPPAEYLLRTGGRPYFVMELVKGTPITKYCDEHRLTPRQRLELFLPVCRAVQHAHQKGIIHRDLKPSNVLVALYDGRPVPKVIDFGIAKATGPKLTDKTLFTEFGTVVGTLEYMSPEQAELNQLDIDTRSDIYALGVLLYELLTGTTPLQRKRLEEAALLEALRLIREEEPQRPSTRLSTTEELPSIAANRGLEPKRLSGLVRGELDWIVMKALEKDRNRRYETANGLAMDVQRYLADEAVQACPPSIRYRLGKFARRNQRLLATLTLVGVLLVAAIVALAISNAQTITEFRRAEGEASRAKENLRLAFKAMDEIFMAEVAQRMRGEPEDAREHEFLLNQGLHFYEEFAKHNEADPTVRLEVAKAHHRTGQLHLRLGHQAQGLAALDRASEIYEQIMADDPADAESRFALSVAYGNKGWPLEARGDIEAARNGYRRGIDLLQPLLTSAASDVKFVEHWTGLLEMLGNSYRNGGDLIEAEKNSRKAVELSVGLADKFDDVQRRLTFQQQMSGYHVNLGKVLSATGRLKVAEDEIRLAIGILDDVHKEAAKVEGYQRGTLPRFRRNMPVTRDLGLAHATLAGILSDQGRSKNAEVELGRAIEFLDQATKDFPGDAGMRRDLAQIERHLAYLLFDGNKHTDAVAHIRRSVELLTALHDLRRDDNDIQGELGYGLAASGDLCFADGDLKGAEDFYKKALNLKKQVLKRNSQVAPCNNDPAWFLATCPDARFRDPAQAVKLAQIAVELTHRENGDYLNTLGVAQYRNSEWQAALTSLTEAQRKRGEADASDWLFLAMSHWRLGDQAKALYCYDRGVKRLSVFEYEPVEYRRFRAEAAKLLQIEK